MKFHWAEARLVTVVDRAGAERLDGAQIIKVGRETPNLEATWHIEAVDRHAIDDFDVDTVGLLSIEVQVRSHHPGEAER